MIFYDFEVFKEDWLAVFIDVTRKTEQVIVNNPDELKALYEANTSNIWVGFNNRHYDQYIMKGILLGMNPKRINDWIILEKREGWQFSSVFNKVPMTNYDVMPNPPVGLKTMEGFLGSNIKETGVPFDINRKLTKAEIEETIKYCRHDVEQTIKIFLEKIDEFNAMHGIVQAFPNMVSLSNIGDSEARITAKVLGCVKQDFKDEFDYFFLPCLRLNKYKYVQDWFEEKKKEALAMDLQNCDKYDKKLWYKSQNLETIVAGIPHSFGFGGLHGAADTPIHKTGQILHVDVNNYYPSMLIAWGLVTRAATNDNYHLVYNTRKSMKAKQIAAAKSGNKAEAKNWKKAQLPYKKMLNALSGGMKDETNPAYDPRNNNCMCINGQLMLLDLIEHLEAVPGFELIQSNTDGLIIWIPDTDEAFEMVDDICWEWEQRCSTDQCSILLELDNISEIYQKDVNNYLWVGADGSVERIGAYVKELSATDNDIPILNKALVEYMVHKTPVEQTINQCDDLIMFQKIVKLSEKYDWVEHEHCTPVITKTGKRVIKEVYEYPEKVKYSYKSYRVFASNSQDDGRLLKRKRVKTKGEKFGNTPDHCFICNDDVCGVKTPQTLDKGWYIDLAKKRLKQFGIVA
nr:MAG TPA: DNA polymerase [Caudoviricetes sp.]